MEVLIKIAQFILSFSLLIIIHELGHYMFARMFGIRVEKFYLFFNPGFSLFKKKIGDTEYGIGWIPFGGYVKIAGMIDESMDTEQMKQPAKPDEFRSKPAWQRLLVMLGGVIMNIVLALVIYIGLSWHYGASYIANEDIEFGWTFDETGHVLGFRNGDIILDVNGNKIENYAMVPYEITISIAPRVRVLRDGQEITVDVPGDAMAKLLENPGFMYPRFPFVAANVQENSGAHRAGVIPGDSLIAADGIAMRWFDEYIEYLAGKENQIVELSLIRTGNDGTKTPMTVEVELSPEGRLGVGAHHFSHYYPTQSFKYGFFQSIPVGLKRTGSDVSNYLRQMKLIFTPKTEAYKSLGGPITIFQVFPNTWSWYSFWSLTAFISLILAVMNLLPIPGLDGGHVLFVLYEIVARRKPGEKFMEYATLCGILIIFSLMIFATGNDIYRYFIK